MSILFKYSDQEHKVKLSKLFDTVSEFLDRFGVPTLIGKTFFEIIGTGNGKSKLSRLLNACGYDQNPDGFFSKLLQLLEKADGTGKIMINGIELPSMLLMAVLEVVLPGNKFFSVKNIRQLEKLSNHNIPEADRVNMQKVIDTYPVRLSMHIIRQMWISRKVACQYMPFVEELDTEGYKNTWVGQFHQGLLEQMYRNRVIFLLNMSCPVYCRFCFRKHKDLRNQNNPSLKDVEKAVAYVGSSPVIKEILITGGDPFLNRKNMACAINGLMKIDHVQTLRLATRSVSYYPDLFLSHDAKWLNYLKRKNIELQDRGKRMEVATHFIHPDEISPESLMIISELVNSGIAVYVQTPFLNNCNDQGPELVRLFNLLRGAGAELHYIYIPCSPIRGNKAYMTPISKGLKAGIYLRAHLSDRIIPKICTATPIGKIEWHTSGWAVGPVAEDKNFIWIRTPYSPDYFTSFTPFANDMNTFRINREGTIDIQYMAHIGDSSWFLGPRPSGGDRPAVQATETVSAVLPMIRKPEKLAPSVVETGSAAISRVHETRVELYAKYNKKNLDYIRNDDRITDVVMILANNAAPWLFQIETLIKELKNIFHVNAVRLRSLEFNYESEIFTPSVIHKLGKLNKVITVNPLRLEIETQFLVADELKPVHSRLVRLLNNKGVTVYNNTPLLGGINDTPEAICELSYGCRKAGIEFHHLYVAGLPVQEQWNQNHPITLDNIVDIAAGVRREGSGREIPRYIIRTVLGEVDFGLSSTVLGEGEKVLVKLLPYDLRYFKAMSTSFSWPAGIREDTDGKPVVPVSGLLKTTNFELS